MISLLPYNTFHFDVEAREGIIVNNVTDLQQLILSGRLLGQSYYILGGGSNVLLTKNIDGIVLLNRITGREVLDKDDSSVAIRVGGGEVWHDVVMRMVGQGRRGCENLAFIPGSVGASPIQNIGAYGVEAKDIIASVSVIDLISGQTREMTAQECFFGYRDSIFKRGDYKHIFITHVTYRLSKKAKPHLEYKDLESYISKHTINQQDLTSQAIAQIIIDIRRVKLPDRTIIGTAGSFFKNPIVSVVVAQSLHQQYPDMPLFNVGEGVSKLSAGRLIDQCGYKNIQRGPVGTYEHHALVLVHHGGGTGVQLWTLAQEIMQAVYDRFGVTINPEVNIR